MHDSSISLDPGDRITICIDEIRLYVSYGPGGVADIALANEADRDSLQIEVSSVTGQIQSITSPSNLVDARSLVVDWEQFLDAKAKQ